jgi:hypothetical protein
VEGRNIANERTFKPDGIYWAKFSFRNGPKRGIMGIILITSDLPNEITQAPAIAARKGRRPLWPAMRPKPFQDSPIQLII